MVKDIRLDGIQIIIFCYLYQFYMNMLYIEILHRNSTDSRQNNKLEAIVLENDYILLRMPDIFFSQHKIWEACENA